MIETILALRYDPKALAVSASDITLGSIPGLSAGWQLFSMIDAATGQIGIGLYGTRGLTDTKRGVSSTSPSTSCPAKLHR
jgi:hypothetical protein